MRNASTAIRGMLNRLRNPTDIYDDFVVHRTYHISPVRHAGPFNKSERGRARRAERRFKMEQRDFDHYELQPHEPLFSRKDYWRAIDMGLI